MFWRNFSSWSGLLSTLFFSSHWLTQDYSTLIRSNLARVSIPVSFDFLFFCSFFRLIKINQIEPLHLVHLYQTSSEILILFSVNYRGVSPKKFHDHPCSARCRLSLKSCAATSSYLKIKMVDESTRKTLAAIPLLKTKAGPRDGDLWIQRLKEEYQTLIKVNFLYGSVG